MDNKKIDYYKQLLLHKKQQHDGVLKNMKELNRGENDKYSATELSSYDNHPAELGSEVYELEHSMGLRVNEEYNLNEIDDALGRVEKGTYGKCESCGKEINESRLNAVPEARMCIDCQKANNERTKHLKRDRPVEEKVIDSTLGKRYLNSQEDDEYEGMDQINDLMKYGSADTPQDLGGYHDYKGFYNNEIDNQGIVDKMDKVSNGQYKRQVE